MAGAVWFLFSIFGGEIWQLLVEGEVEHDGASPSVTTELALITPSGLCWPCGWLDGICCDCVSAELEKLLMLSSFSVEKPLLLSGC